jgi:glycosyltransferase involved in cell wall biosynthesis
MAAAMNVPELVHVRTPTYRRPEALRRCLESLIAQSWQNWVCDVFDDDRDAAGLEVVTQIADRRIFYHHNQPQLFASKNIDQCFSRRNPHGARYFCVVEDDNFILPRFMEENIAICRSEAAKVVFRNQLVEFNSGTPEAKLSASGILDDMFKEGFYEPDEFRLSLLPGIGISNGGVFWSDDARSELEIGYDCTATLQEYMRTFSIDDRIYVAMQPLAVWAQNGEQTTRNLEIGASYMKRELDLKRAVQVLQNEAWRLAPPSERKSFLTSDRFAYEPRLRAQGMVKGLISARVGSVLGARETLELISRGLLIRFGGRLTEDFQRFVESRKRAFARHAQG